MMRPFFFNAHRQFVSVSVWRLVNLTIGNGLTGLLIMLDLIRNWVSPQDSAWAAN